jgi:predicted Ser/Thr protein kinase
MTDPDTLPKRPSDPLRSQVEQVLSATYELEEEIGRGGMGVVYRARDKRLKRMVAVKLLPPELAFRDDIRSRFLREAATAAQLNHPNIVPIYTVEEANNLVFFIMGYVNGANLAQYLLDHGVLPAEKVRKILREVADALAYAHARNVIHRDIKPDNILLDTETGRTMVTDFGIARAVHESGGTRLTTTGVAIGTPAYMSPEQSAGDRDVDGRSDIYSLGVVGYQLLCGEPPFIAPNTPALLVKHLAEVPKPLNERCVVPEDLNAIIMRCLAKDPSDRFVDANELVAALDGRLAVNGSGRETTFAAYPVDRKANGTTATYRETSNGGVGEMQTIAQIPGQGAFPVPYADPAQPANWATAQSDMVRWDAPPVRRFRRRLVTFLIVNVVFVILSIFGQHNFWWFSGLWSIWLAFGYAKLWEQGYDWRDVLRQPHDALFADIVSEKIDDTKALFDPAARERVRKRMQTMRARTGVRPGLLTPPAPGTQLDVERDVGELSRVPYGASASTAGAEPESFTTQLAAQLPAVQEATVLRNDILRMFNELSEEQRSQLPDVIAPVDALFGRIKVLATTVNELSAADVPGLAEATEQEIVQLEAEANPFDEERSERRIRRLAQLRRQRISLRDIQRRNEETSQKLQRCLSSMRTVRLDLVRFRSGMMSAEGVTQVAEQAMQLGREVDAVLYAQEELARVLAKKS